MKRRTFLRHTAHAIGIPAMLGPLGFSSFAQSLSGYLEDSDRVLVLIYLQGGNDGLNTVIPLDQLSALNKVRPDVILPESKLLNLPGTEVALHPSLAGLKELFEEDRLRILQNVGYPEQNYSHFRSTDIWMSGSDSETLLASGWTGRYLEQEFPGYPLEYPNEQHTDPLAIEVGYGSSMLFQGNAAAMSMVIKDPTDFYGFVNEEEGQLPDTVAGDKLNHIRLTIQQSQLYGEVVKKAASKITYQKPYPENDLAEQLKIVAQLIAGGLKTPLYLVRLRGFDTHDNQVESSDHTIGEHAELLSQVDSSIMAFLKDLEYHGVDDRVTGLTFSEFGRRIISNKSLGTDHGAAAPMFVFGNRVVPGVLGENPQIPSNATYKDNLPWQYDFKQVYGSVLEQWFGSTESERNTILFDEFTTLPVIKSGAVNARTLTKPDGLTVYPNPMKDAATVSFVGNGGETQIVFLDNNGKQLELLYRGKPGAGAHTVQWDTAHLPAGNYFIVLQDAMRKKVFQVLKVK